MPFLTATQVTVHFIGICMFTSGVTNDPGAHVIVPRIVYSAIPNEIAHVPKDYATPSIGFEETPAPTPAKPQQTKPVAASSPGSRYATIGGINTAFPVRPHIEDHMAAIVFPTSEYDTSSTAAWTKKDFPQGKPYSYVMLNGERLSLNTNWAPSQINFGQLQLPHLKNDCCSAMTDLNTSFKKPYPGAAAVVDIPNGTLSNCATDVGSSTMRLDTELKLNSASTFEISAGSKKLRLHPSPGKTSIDLFIVNLPARYVLNSDHTELPTTNMAGMDHSLAYYWMSINPSASCPTLREWLKTHTVSGGTCALPDFTLAQQQQLIRLGPLPGKGHQADSAVSVNFECSNSQWP